MKVVDLIKALQKYNINARQYARPPAGPDVFAITIKNDPKPEGTVLVNQGTAKITIHGSRKHRQAVVTVKEQGRSITRKVATTMHQNRRPRPEEINSHLIGAFPMVIPGEVKWTVADTTCKKRPIPPPEELPEGQEEDPRVKRLRERIIWEVSGIVTGVVENKTVNHFLIGIDETRNFISPLKRHVNSVEEAHRILRPPEVKKVDLEKGRAPRQGEWFFVRCARTVANMLNRLATHESNKIKTYRLGTTTHTAKSAVVVNKNTYARGWVIDRRRGHHRSLWLDYWSQVFRNKEAQFKVSPEQQAAAKRRARSWD